MHHTYNFKNGIKVNTTVKKTAQYFTQDQVDNMWSNGITMATCLNLTIMDELYNFAKFVTKPIPVGRSGTLAIHLLTKYPLGDIGYKYIDTKLSGTIVPLKSELFCLHFLMNFKERIPSLYEQSTNKALVNALNDHLKANKKDFSDAQYSDCEHLINTLLLPKT